MPFPLGVELARVAKTVGREFDRALAEAGGSAPVWLVLATLKGQRPETQAALANAVGIEAATLTHHLNRLEREGLVTRARDPGNRRVQRVELTAEGEAAFVRMRAAVTAFDARLRERIPEADQDTLRRLLAQLAANAEAAEPPATPRA